ncbi:hypothetical protein [Deinococcus budaensis]|uniref:YopA central domain-containing protein n=1 Tax=Deinococcus budaensis TaxID=1665626 RepID=A0A7W8GH17_9DEIO|nr:hypothetical protein [Deinococcus budaensis]MBB5235512.1 hypothetical protein [Deinococcus budaensis]
MLADDWHITFRTDREYYGGSSGMPDNGYVVTHIGRVTKRDGEVFRPFEAQKILGIVRSWFTILRGAWVTALPVGFNSEGVKVWIDFKQERVQKLLRHEEILIDYNFETWSSMFLRFRDLYSEDDYRSTIETAVDWYVEARKPDRPPTSAIIHVHLALEVLSWSILVKHSGMVSADGYSNMPSYDRIRLLLFWVGIKNDVPSSLYNLIEYLKDEAKSSGHSGKLKEGKTKKGGAEIISETRNRIMHPNGRGDPRNLDVSVAYSIIALGLWYIELTFLKLLDYEGKYYNRLPPEEIDPEGDPIYKDVPWVKN